MIRAVCFDAGATLLHPDPPVEEIYGRVFREDGARVEPEALREALHAAWGRVQAARAGDRYGGVSGEEAFWRAFLSGVRESIDGGVVSDAAFGRLATHFRDPGSWAVYGDVLPTLEELAGRGLELAVISNWDSHLPRLLDALSSRRSSASFRFRRSRRPASPLPRSSTARAGSSASRPSEALHVGTRSGTTSRARGARVSTALLLDRDGRHADAPERITSLSQISSRL